MPTIRVNGVMNALVHKGSGWLSPATLPDVCKTPTPSGPIPMPYPNLSMVNTLTGGTTTVTVDGGKMAGHKPSKFSMSTGDEPGTLGGIKSSTFKQASSWITYSFDVKLEGKNACRFSDKKFQNNENTVDMAGIVGPVVMVRVDDVNMKCGELNQYGEQKKKSGENKFDRDHVPSKGALKAKAAEMMKRSVEKLSTCVSDTITASALSIVIPKEVHQQVSETYGQSREDAKADAKDLQKAAKRDTEALEKANMNDKECEAAYKKAAEQIRKITNEDYEKWIKDIIKGCKH
jgi:hypothetical protein